MGFERIGVERVWQGRIGDVRVERWRMEDGEEVEREVVGHPGAVAVVAHDGEVIYMVSQPREPVGEPSLLELPAGKLDDDSEDVLATAKRELAEEIGKGARTWKRLTTFYSSPGFSDEEIHVYLATDLYDESAEADENERIEIEAVPLSKLDDLIRDCRDGKSLAGLLWFKAFEGGVA
ncbi:MAG TPA: NUDIX hydrolase [Solirubrobacteraceae bacterium]|nr:NUDIX hydrolase [Solirubrobacteraceae bacterium]